MEKAKLTEMDTKLSQKAKRPLIRKFLSDRVNPSEISRRIGVSHRMVYRWKERDSIQDKPRSGRLSVVINPIKDKIEETIRDKVGVGTRKCSSLSEHDRVGCRTEVCQKQATLVHQKLDRPRPIL